MALFAISYALTYSTVNTDASSRLSSSPKQETVSGILALSWYVLRQVLVNQHSLGV
jgi:hypothetical protein